MGYSKVGYPKNPELLSANIGDVAGGDYLKIEADGSWQAEGDATVWDDIVGSLIGRRLSTTPGTVDYNWTENTITMQPSGDISDPNDRLMFNFQYEHSARPDGEMRLHIHWEQPDATARTFTVQYRIQKNGEAKTTAWTTATASTTTNNVFTYTAGTLNQITEIVNIDMTGAGLSATVEFRFTRSDSNSGNIEATFIDAHIERNTNGSRTEYVK